MPTPNPAALEFLLSRRSRPAKTLTTPVPSREALLPLLTAAARTPDHGKLEPWRFIVLGRDSAKIPPLEMTYAAGAACLALLNAALAAGWGANWLSGWPSHDAGFGQAALGLAENERIAGFIHIGTETATPPERPRPDLEKIVTWALD